MIGEVSLVPHMPAQPMQADLLPAGYTAAQRTPCPVQGPDPRRFKSACIYLFDVAGSTG